MMSNLITGVIGHTPLVKLRKVVPAGCADIYVKLEYFNPTGSFKDRMAISIIEQAETRGELTGGMTVMECTAGGTGTALAMVCSVKGYPFTVVSSDAFAPDKLRAMRIFGARLEILPSEGGRITPDLIPRMIQRVGQLQAETGGYWTRQFENRDALPGYRRMGDEIMEQLQKPVDLFCAAVGTAGMFTGVSQSLRSRYPSLELVVLEPASAPLLSKGQTGTHSIDGISVGFIPPLLDRNLGFSLKTVHEAEARNMARRLAAEEGILGGTSTGLNVAAAIELGLEKGPGYTIVTVACDSGLKYLQGGLFA